MRRVDKLAYCISFTNIKQTEIVNSVKEPILMPLMSPVFVSSHYLDGGIHHYLYVRLCQRRPPEISPVSVFFWSYSKFWEYYFIQTNIIKELLEFSAALVAVLSVLSFLFWHEALLTVIAYNLLYDRKDCSIIKFTIKYIGTLRVTQFKFRFNTTTNNGRDSYWSTYFKFM